MSVRVVIADDQHLVRAGLTTILDSEPDIQIVAEAEDGRRAVELARRLRPDVLLMDVRMPVLDGIAATRELRRDPDVETRIVMLTTFDLDEYVYEALRAGASGFLVKDIRDDELVTAVRTAARGDGLFAPSVTRRLVEAYIRRPPAGGTPGPGADTLTPRELEVWQLVARGLSNAEIAAALVVGEATVKTHVARVMAKLRARDRVETVIRAYEHGLV
ncbi:MAG: response regulator transcription factor [Kineosporiaceae bacterium]